MTRPAPRDGSTLEWARFLPATRAEGPGQRSAIWLQGCSIHCPGCFNPQLWAAHGATVDSTTELAALLVAETLSAGSEGITLLGGEPFDQAAATATLAEAFAAAGLSVMTFTGYRFEHLREWAADRPDIARLLAATDLLADGPFLRDRVDHRRPWIGSTNQGLRALTPRYFDEIARIDRDGGMDAIEVRIRSTGEVEVNGWADDAVLAELLLDLGARTDKPGSRPGKATP